VKLSATLVQRARQDSAVLAALALRDEQTGQPVQLQPAHRSLHRLWQGHPRSVAWACPEFGKSANLAAYTAWRIGCDPSLRVGYLSATVQQAQRHLRAVAILLSSPGFAQVFPGLSVARMTADELTVAPRPATIKDATCIAGAFDLSSMLGARLDLVLCDDVITREQARSASTRDQAYADFIAVTSSRVAPGGQIHCIGTAEHPEDILHRLARQGWPSLKLPVLDAQGQPTFPAKWPPARIEARRLELGPVRFMATMLCEATSEAALCFRAEDLERALSNGLATVHSEIPAGRVVIGVDPAWTSKPGADESGIVMCTIDRDGFRHLVHVEGWRMHYEALANRVIELARVNRATVYIESNGAGSMIADAIGRKAPCKPLSTSRQSKEARVEALSAELASGRWIFRQPLGSPGSELRKLLSDCHVFSFDRHCGDRLAALLMAVEGIREIESRPKGGVLNVHRTEGGRWTFTR
jgi:Terminase RNaseH-like domain